MEIEKTYFVYTNGVVTKLYLLKNEKYLLDISHLNTGRKLVYKPLEKKEALEIIAKNISGEYGTFLKSK